MSVKTAAIVTLLGVVCLAPLAGAQSATLRTPWGDPDLQGIWTGSTLTPLERPTGLAGKEFLTEEEAASLERNADERRFVERVPSAGDPGTYNQTWFDPGTRLVPDRRTALIVDPPDGRVPYTPEMRERDRAQGAYRVNGARNSWVDVDTGERCMSDGLPMFWLGYNPNHQIVQTPDHVVIVHEMFRDRRIIPLADRPRNGIRQWNGDMHGRWDGDTLVVESTHFIDGSADRWAATWRMPTHTMHLVEHFTRVDADTLEYEFTLTDPREVHQPVERPHPADDQPGVARRHPGSAVRVRLPRGQLQHRQRPPRRPRRGAGRGRRWRTGVMPPVETVTVTIATPRRSPESASRVRSGYRRAPDATLDRRERPACTQWLQALPD